MNPQRCKQQLLAILLRTCRTLLHSKEVLPTKILQTKMKNQTWDDPAMHVSIEVYFFIQYREDLFADRVKRDPNLIEDASRQFHIIAIIK
mmetsp:Transcript_16574/g.31508  ORF Transcript_16574/g.31508 Transcript_16574/m.31508 type:complete len:90 (-) Transcript_16574:717-986(-)